MYHIIRWDGVLMASFSSREEAIRQYMKEAGCVMVYNDAGVNICPGITRGEWGKCTLRVCRSYLGKIMFLGLDP